MANLPGGDDDSDNKAKKAWNGRAGAPVGWSEELDRVVALPRRAPVIEGSATSKALIELCMDKHSRGPRQCECHTIKPPKPCIKEFLHIQAWCLYEAGCAGGLVTSAATGSGKTLIGIMAPMVIANCKLALLLIPPSLIDQIQNDWLRFREHFKVPNMCIEVEGRMRTYSSDPDAPMLRVLPYSKLSSIRSSAWISQLKPDLVICDEADAIAGESARKRRVMREFVNNPNMRYVAMTGSIVDSKLEEMWIHFLLALRDQSPMPIDEIVVEDWGRAINAVPNPAQAGELMRLCAPGEKVRSGFRRRLAETPGVVMVEGEQVVETSEGKRVEVVLRERNPGALPEKVKQGLALVDLWKRPDTLGGAEFDIDIQDPMEKARVAREVAQGMFYKWIFPPKKSPHNADHGVRTLWYGHRKAWFSIARECMQRGDEFMDSFGLVEQAAMRGWGDIPADPRLPSWRPPEWPLWRDIRNMIIPQQAAVRLDPYMVDDAAAWGKEQPGIIWYSMREFAYWMRERHGTPVFEGGMGQELMAENGKRSIAVSINAHGRGRDGLQFLFHHQNIVQFPSSSRKLQQLLARLHRRHQQNDSVYTYTYKHVEPLRKAYEQAKMRAEFVAEATGDIHKIVTAVRR
jgi:hypothetical protein